MSIFSLFLSIISFYRGLRLAFIVGFTVLDVGNALYMFYNGEESSTS